MAEDELHPLRRFYRQRLAQYAWARRLKPHAVALWFLVQRMQYGLIWRVKYPILRLRFLTAQNFTSLSLRMSGIHAGLGQNAAVCRTFSPPVRVKLASALAALGRGVLRLADAAAPPGSGGITFYAMRSFSDYSRDAESVQVVLAEAQRVPLAMPAVLSDRTDHGIRSGEWMLDVPEVRAFEVRNAELVGKCDFVFTGWQCMQHGLYRFERDLPAEEMHGLVSINVRRKLVSRAPSVHEPLPELPAAVAMVGSATSNYIHWLTETAAKLALLEQAQAYRGLPLIVDAELHPNVLDSLRALNSSGRTLVPLARGQVCKVGRLVVISPVAYVPFDYRRGFRMDKLPITPDWAMYVPQAVRALRAALVPRPMLPAGGGRRLFLRRNSASRQMQNAEAVEKALVAAGFEVIVPEVLSFHEQVSLFSQAGTIVAQAGAALGNIIFAPPGCHVVILTAWSPYSIYYYFSNLAAMLGQRCTLALFEAESTDAAHPAHRGLSVDVGTLQEAIAL